MITKEEVNRLRFSKETSRVERTISKGDMDKFQEAICAFSNDMSNSRKPGYLLIGVHDDGALSGLKVDDKFFVKISAIRSSGNILPIPAMTCESFEFEDGDILVVEVQPSLYPPVKYRGRTFIRIGPRRDIASEAEERLLIERRTAYMPTFDVTPCFHASIEDLNVEKFKSVYLPASLPAETLKNDDRSIKEQMAAVGFYDLENDCPTFGAIALFGHNLRKYMPGLYVQFVRFDGLDVTSPVEDERQFDGGYIELLPKLEAFIEMAIVRRRPVPVSVLREEMVSNYPYWALRELILNSLMHRDMQGNGPIRLYEFKDRIELMNPGGLYGNARPENFPYINDYRNPIVAAAFKTLGYVNMFNRGVREVQRQLEENGNPPAIFNVDRLTAFEVTIPNSLTTKGDKSKGTSHAKGGKSEGTSQAKSTKSEGASQAKSTKSEGASQAKSTKSERISQAKSTKSEGASQAKSTKSEGTSQAKSTKSEGTSQGTSQYINGIDNQIDISSVPSQSVPSQGVPSQGASRGVPSQGKGDKSEGTSQTKGTKSERIIIRRDGGVYIKSLIIKFCLTPKSLKEICNYLGVTATKKVKNRYLNDLIDDDELAMTLPDKPTSRFQKYVATGKTKRTK